MLLVLVIISIEHNTNVLDRPVNYDTSENILILTAQVNVNQENRCLHFMSNLWSIVRIRLMGNSKPKGEGSPARRVMTAWSNDVAYEDVFVEQLKNLVNAGDVVIGISASGNSENVIRTMRHAVDIGCNTIGWSGFGGGKLATICDVNVVVDSHQYGPVEDVHLILNHVLHAWIQEEFA